MYNPDIEAVLVEACSGTGFARVPGNGITHPPPNVVTGLDTAEEFYILIVRTDQKLFMFGQPTVQFFRRRKAQLRVI